jgi:hypothetical protein
MPKLWSGCGRQEVLTPFTTDPQALRLEPLLVLKLRAASKYSSDW